MLEDIAAERSRLGVAGVSGDELDRQLAAFEAERRLFYERQLEEFRAELESQRSALERDLNVLRREYATELAERDDLIAYYREEEAKQRAQLEEQSRVLALAQVESNETLAAARRELADLQLEREQTVAVENQIIGQLSEIRAAIQLEDPEQASTLIDRLRTFLQQDSVIAVTDLSRRLEIDLFMLDSLQQLVQGQAAADSGALSISDELLMLERIRATFASAQSAVAAGDDATATEMYGQLLQVMPQVSSAHTVLREGAVTEAVEAAVEEAVETAVPVAVEEATSELQQEVDDEQAAISAEFAGLVARAERAVAAGNYDFALSAYREALAAVPATRGLEDSILPPITRMGFDLVNFADDEQGGQIPTRRSSWLSWHATPASTSAACGRCSPNG